jgi:hypothetical protein
MGMHIGQHHVDVPLVARLLREQFPDWSRFPVKPVVGSGTVNAIAAALIIGKSRTSETWP